MISPEFLEYLRCPLNPSKTRLRLEGEALVCERCTLRFAIRNGIPNLVAEEAELPQGCESLADLPCQRESGRTAPAPRLGHAGERGASAP